MNIRAKIVNTAAALLTLCGASFASMQTTVEDLIRTRKYDMSGLGIVIKNLERDSVVVSINSDVPMNPASVQKLVTGAAALEILGPNFMHTTSVYTNGTFRADSGIIRGNLYIKGAGEPGLNAEKIWLLVQHLRHRGVKKVTGDLVIDNFFFDDVTLGPGFSEEENRSFQALISALPANYNSVAIHHRPGDTLGSPVHIDIFPRVDGFKINSTATTVDGARGKLDVATVRTGGTTHINVKGTMGVNEPPAYTYRRMWQTWEALGGAFRAQCTANGLIIDGKTVRSKTPDTLVTNGAFYSFGGEPITAFINHMFKWSSNFVSEMLLKTMGARQKKEPGTWPKGVAVIEEWWGSRGLPGTPQIINGSGMAHIKNQVKNRDGEMVRAENLISAGQLVALLTHVSKQKNYFPDYLAALPSSGVDGTLASRFKRSPLRGLVRGKTGTLNSFNTSTLAGYMLLDDATYAFAIFCAGVGPSQFDNWVLQEQILEAVAGVGGGAWR